MKKTPSLSPEEKYDLYYKPVYLSPKNSLTVSLMTFYQLIVIFASLLSLQTVSADDCDVYSQLEKKASCGKDGYLVQYGLKNCRIFAAPETIARFSPAGQKFLKCTRDCLVTYLKTLFKRNTPACDVLFDSAVESHSSCYVKCGFCKICQTEKMALFKSYDIMDFLSIKSLSTVVTVLRKCGAFTCLRLF
ncbi:unnamed protein product [Nippostrongylus brasiliensis]|uniref:Uncharacterized protein n=1 Tax=Nippostrongylus brasiliensis TaxID=27835 RepID=A0A158QY83_NIPBR|nr:unnamed protein product [Nippostrongylus brasiliensis]